MNHQQNLSKIALVSFVLVLIGFFIDGDARIPGLSVNIFEIAMMACILFLIFTLGYGISQGIRLLLRSSR